MHILVALSFVDNPFNKPEINHKDGNKLNNIPSNLEWVTSKENNIHALKSGLRKAPKGSLHHSTTFTDSDVFEIRDRIKNGCKDSDIAKDYGVTQTAISCIRRRVTWKHI